MKASEVRQSFLDFFSKKNHKIVPSAPVAPLDDPTLLFTNAGMNQFKDVFLGTGQRPYTRAADSQKCIRVSGKHNDLEEVGHDTYHHTFFEMLGNWSFGDYYKEEAILWAWELLTKIWGLTKDSIWATVFREDDEAEVLWKKVTDIAPSRVVRFDEKDNFWEMGATGPCGPCSEIHIDLGEGFCDKQHVKGHRCGINAGCARYIELWNLVFIQYNRDENGALHVLPCRHVDTGMGFERVTAVLQGKKSNYETDVFTPVLDGIAGLVKNDWKQSGDIAAFRVIADHIRALTFAITDGVLPSNEGRGYVLRRLLRRAARYGRNLGMHEPFIYKLVPVLIRTMGEAYPEIREREQHTTHVIQSEEDRFNDVLDRGIEIFESITQGLTGGNREIPGSDAFRLYDTYGFPLDLTQLMAREKGLTVDETGFQAAMDAQRERARQSAQFSVSQSDDWTVLSEGEESRFVGYESMSARATIRRFQNANGQILCILDQTPFYAESGGQVGDQGVLTGGNFVIRILNTVKQGDQILHVGHFESGDRIEDPGVEAAVNRDERLSTARNHTATHLLHKALKNVLGDHVNQAGSLVAPDHLRFDFTHFGGMTSEQIEQVEWEVNRQVRNNIRVQTFNTSIDEAKSRGATALFGEKYGERVRVVQMDEYSMELCGGTHLEFTGQIGCFRIVSEESVSAGVRRIEALTGEGADHLIRQEKMCLHDAASLLKCRPDELVNKIAILLEERKSQEKKLRQVQKMSAGSDLEALLNKAEPVSGIPVACGRIEVPDVDALRDFGDRVREKLKSGVVMLGAVLNDKANLLCVVTDDLIRDKGLKAGDIVKEAARIVDGGGGGKPHMALAGGKDVARIQDALDAVPGIVKALLK
ncbi:alanine--tRNA ligase [bacterium]|nr:alanine--tRNA ligase [bacterium]